MKGRLLPYINLLKKKAAGEIPTTARWLRNYINNHENYEKNGRISPTIADDLLKRCDDIGMGIIQEKSLLGDVFIENLSSECCSDEELKPFLADNYDKLVASGVVDCVKYKPSNSCGDGSHPFIDANEEEKRMFTPYLESARCK